MGTCCGGVQGDLALADAHAVGTKVSQSQDALAICDHYNTHVLLGPGLELLEDLALVCQADVQAMGLEGQGVVLLTGLSDGGCVDEWKDLFRVLEKQGVVNLAVRVEQVPQVHVAVDGLLNRPESPQR